MRQERKPSFAAASFVPCPGRAPSRKRTPVELIESLFEIAVERIFRNILVSDKKGVFRCLLFPRGRLPPEGAELLFA